MHATGLPRLHIFLVRLLLHVGVCLTVASTSSAQLPTPALLGYWHNWEGGAPYLHLDSVDTRYNVIAVAFALPVSNNDMTMTFTPAKGTQQEFITRMQRVRAQGKKVLLSIGGATASVDLTTTVNRDAFVSSLTSLLTGYGFDGLDIDIENGASILINGGTIAAPQNVAQLNLIAALRSIMYNYRSSFNRKMILTFAPETAYVQGGMSGFGGIWGGYLPLLHAMRDSLDLLHVQLYNSGTMYGIDGNIYAQGTADFMVAMTEAVIQGFNSRGGGFFTGLPATKVLIGLPASTQAAGGGFCDTSVIRSAVRYLRGVGPRPGSYVLARSSGYADLQGMMTWSMNWDATTTNRTRYQFAITFEELFGVPLAVPDACTIVAPQDNEQLQSNNVTIRWRASRPSITAYHLDLRINGGTFINDSTLSDTLRSATLPGASAVWVRVRARNARGWGAWSAFTVFNSLPVPDVVVHVSPAEGSSVESDTCVLRWRRGTFGADSYRVRVMALTGSGKIDTTVRDTSLTLRLVAGESYSWTVNARNASGVSVWSAPWIFHTPSAPEQSITLTPRDDMRVKEDTTLLVWRVTGPIVRRYHVELREDGVLTLSDSTLSDTVRPYIHDKKYALVQWRVRAWNHWGWGAWSDVASYTHVTLPGIVVQELPEDGALVRSKEVLLSWQRIRNVTAEYELQVQSDTVNAFMSTPDTSYAYTLRTDVAEHRWRVRARNEAGSGPWSAWRTLIFRDTVSSITLEDPYPGSDDCAFTVSPNPGMGIRTIRSDRDRIDNVIITDLQGRVVFNAWVSVGRGGTPLAWTPSQRGVYFLRMASCTRVLIVE